jgi:hypothetical protein
MSVPATLLFGVHNGLTHLFPPPVLPSEEPRVLAVSLCGQRLPVILAARMPEGERGLLCHECRAAHRDALRARHREAW